MYMRSHCSLNRILLRRARMVRHGRTLKSHVLVSSDLDEAELHDLASDVLPPLPEGSRQQGNISRWSWRFTSMDRR